MISPPTLVPRLATPLAELLVRTLNGKSAVERHHCAFYLGEAALKLVGAAAVASWCASDPAEDDPLRRRVSALARPSLGQWLAWVRALAQRPEHPALQFASLPSEAATAWVETGLGHEVLDRSGLRRVRKDGLVGFFEQLVAYRNGVLGHGAQRVRSFYEGMTPVLLDAVLEQLHAVPWLLDGHLWLADPEEPWRQLLGLAALPSDAPPVPDPASRDLHGIVLVHDDRVLPLAPLLHSATDATLERDRVLFLNRGIVRGRTLRRVELLDYATGETVDEPQLVPGLAQLLAMAGSEQDVARFKA